MADGFAEREAATTMLSTHWRFAPRRRRTVGADKAYDTADFVDSCASCTPRRTSRRISRAAAAARSTPAPRDTTGYAMSQHARPRIEPAFGWLKTIAWMRKVKLRGLPKVDWLFVFASAAFNLIRLPKLLPASAGDEERRVASPAGGMRYVGPPETFIEGDNIGADCACGSKKTHTGR